MCVEYRVLRINKENIIKFKEHLEVLGKVRTIVFKIIVKRYRRFFLKIGMMKITLIKENLTFWLKLKYSKSLVCERIL